MVLLYSLLWAPARTSSARLMATLPIMERELAQMQEQARQARELGRMSANITPINDSLRDALVASLARRSIANAQISVLNGVVQIKLTNVPSQMGLAGLMKYANDTSCKLLKLM